EGEVVGAPVVRNQRQERGRHEEERYIELWAIGAMEAEDHDKQEKGNKKERLLMRHDLVLPAQVPMQHDCDQIDALQRLYSCANDDEPENGAHVLHPCHQVIRQQVGFEQIDKGPNLQDDDPEGSTARQPMCHSNRNTEQEGQQRQQQCPPLEQGAAARQVAPDYHQEQQQEKEAERPFDESFQLRRPVKEVEAVGQDGCCEVLLFHEYHGPYQEVEACDGPERDSDKRAEGRHQAQQETQTDGGVPQHQQ